MPYNWIIQMNNITPTVAGENEDGPQMNYNLDGYDLQGF